MHLVLRASAAPLFMDMALLHGRCVGVSLCALDHAADDAGAAGMQRDRTQPVPPHTAPAPAPATTLPLPPPKLGLHPLEWDLARGMSGERRDEFIGGRLALRRALSHLPSAHQHPLLPCAAGAPILPAGVTGSISHKAGLVVAIAADAAPVADGADGGGGGGRVGDAAGAGAATTTTTKTRAVGVDVELAVVSSFDEEGRFARRVLTPAERVSLGSAALLQALLPAAAVAAAAAAAGTTAAAGAAGAGGRQQLATRKGGAGVCGSGGRHRGSSDAAAAAAATAAAAAGEGTAALQLQLARGLEVKLRFSLKEALFKALFPFVGRRVAFLEAEVRPRADGSCAARLTGLPSAVGAGEPAAAAAVGGDAAADVTCRDDLADLTLELQWATLDVDGELFFLTTACVEGRAPPAADAEAVAAEAEAEAEAEAAGILAGHRHHA